jgi:hypothetical protein
VHINGGQAGETSVSLVSPSFVYWSRGAEGILTTELMWSRGSAEYLAYTFRRPRGTDPRPKPRAYAGALSGELLLIRGAPSVWISPGACFLILAFMRIASGDAVQ